MNKRNVPTIFFRERSTLLRMMAQPPALAGISTFVRNISQTTHVYRDVCGLNCIQNDESELLVCLPNGRNRENEFLGWVKFKQLRHASKSPINHEQENVGICIIVKHL